MRREMGEALKLLLLLSVVNLGVSALIHRRIGTLESRKSCGEGQYYSQDAGFCYDCKKCGDFYYESKECTETTDTVCKWCGIELNFAEESEDVLGAYEDECMVGRLEYINKMETIDQLEAAEKYGHSDSGEAREVKETEEETDPDLFQSEEEVSKESIKKKLAKEEVEKKIERENEIHHGNVCQEGQYFNYEAGHCFDCTSCGHFLYETAKCTKSSNTVCTWCGKEPKFDAITDIVLASYQNKCLMVQLDFVGMNELFDSEEEENISEEAFYDNEEDSEEVDAKVKVAMEKKEEDDLVRTLALKSGQKSVEEDSEQESEEEAETEVTDEEVDKYLEKSISKTVHAYFIEKSKKMKKSDEFDFERRENVQEAEQNILYPDIYEPNWMRNIPYHPIDLTQKKEDSSEEPDDRIISWDKWVDDKVKPIRTADIVEAEEISPYENIVVLAETEGTGQEKTFSNTVLMFCVCLTIFTLGYAFFACKRVPKHRHVFHGVPVDSPDYHMILHASQHIEELEKKEKKASRHIHENPTFDI